MRCAGPSPTRATLKTRPDLVGLSGQSSGGHLAMLVAMRPHDPRYAAIALPAGSPAHDASVRCVIMSWPVINPLSRYRHAKRAQAGANPPEWPKSIIARQDSYWRSEANMAEGNPTLALERGEKVLTPPAIWFQGRGDIMHDYKDTESTFDGNEPQRFCAAYRKAGGSIALEYIDMERAPAIRRTCRSAAPCSAGWSSSSSSTSGSDRTYGAEERTWPHRSLFQESPPQRRQERRGSPERR